MSGDLSAINSILLWFLYLTKGTNPDRVQLLSTSRACYIEALNQNGPSNVRLSFRQITARWFLLITDYLKWVNLVLQMNCYFVSRRLWLLDKSMVLTGGLGLFNNGFFILPASFTFHFFNLMNPIYDITRAVLQNSRKGYIFYKRYVANRGSWLSL